MAQQQFVQLKIRRETHARLQQVIASLDLAESMGMRQNERHHLKDIITNDTAINTLIDFREKHAERRRESAAGRRKNKNEKEETVSKEEIEQSMEEESGQQAPVETEGSWTDTSGTTFSGR